MKYLIIFLYLLNFKIYAKDTVYLVPQTKPELQLGNSAPPLKKIALNRPENFFYVGLERGSLTYKLPTLNNGTNEFKPELVGIVLGKKTANNFYLYHGYFELAGDWQRFKRETGVFSQSLNIFHISLFQNIDLYQNTKYPFIFSVGIGISPIYLTATQSIFGNSLSELGAMGILKFDFAFPQKSFEYLISLKSGWGNVNSTKMYLTNLNIGVNFE